MLRERIKVMAIGAAMGAAEVVPGVSGGTIAFVTGIYERLVNALKRFTPALAFRVYRQGVKDTWQTVDGSFLLFLFGSMGLAVFALASGVGYLLEHEPILIWSFFFGLVVASSWVVMRQISRFGIDLLLAGATGLIVGIIITTMVPVTLPATYWALFVGGAVAVCAWILPGLSGSFILLILGLYGVVIDAIGRFDLISLGALAAGCILGLVSFAQLMSRLFYYYRDETLAVLTGFMLGSLSRLWPWKQTLSYQLKDDGGQIPLVQEPVLPGVYHDLTGSSPEISMAIASALVGLVLVIIIDILTPSYRDRSIER